MQTFILWQQLWKRVLWKLKEPIFLIRTTFLTMAPFSLLLRIAVYPYDYMDDQEKFDETPLPEKEDLYSHLNMEENTDANYTHAKRFFRAISWFICSK